MSVKGWAINEFLFNISMGKPPEEAFKIVERKDIPALYTGEYPGSREVDERLNKPTNVVLYTIGTFQVVPELTGRN